MSLKYTRFINTDLMVSLQKYTNFSFLLSLSSDDFFHFVSLVKTSSVCTESGLSDSEGLLGISGNTGLNELNHSLLIGSESDSLSNDFSDELDSGTELSLSLRRDGSSLGLGNFSGDVAFVGADGDISGFTSGHFFLRRVCVFVY